MNPTLIEQYRALHREKSSYGNGITYMHKIIDFINTYQLRRILDFGCGKGAMKSWIDHKRRTMFTYEGVEWINYDPAIPEYDKLPEGKFDLVIANDVFEHFDPNQLKEELKFINSISRCVFANISCRPARQILPDGRNAHTCLLPAAEWQLEMTYAFGELKSCVYSQWHPKNKNLSTLWVKDNLLKNFNSLDAEIEF